MTRRDGAMTVRMVRPQAMAAVAGLAGLAVHSALMLAKDALGILPGFQPYEDFQRPLGAWAGEKLGSLTLSDRGAALGVSVCPTSRASPGAEHLDEGARLRGPCVGRHDKGFFLHARHGFLGLRLGYGLWPAAFMFPMLAASSLG